MSFDDQSYDKVVTIFKDSKPYFSPNYEQTFGMEPALTSQKSIELTEEKTRIKLEPFFEACF